VLDHLAGGGAVVHGDGREIGIGAGRRHQHAAHFQFAHQGLQRAEVAFRRQQDHLADAAVADEGADAVLPAGHRAVEQVDRQVAAGLDAGQQQGVMDLGVIAAAGIAHQHADRRRGLGAQAAGHRAGLVAEFLHGRADAIARLGADALMIVEHARDRLGRDIRPLGHIVDRRHSVSIPSSRSSLGLTTVKVAGARRRVMQAIAYGVCIVMHVDMNGSK
jgi:hypothetical protein